MDWAVAGTAIVGIAAIVAGSRNAAGQRDLEGVRIRADDQRRIDDRREDRRLRRQDAYARYIVALDVLDTYGSGYTPTEEKFETALHELNSAGSVLELLAPPHVRRANSSVSAVYHDISTRMADYAATEPGAPARLHAHAYHEHRSEMMRAVDVLKEAMRFDINAEEADHPPQ